MKKLFEQKGVMIVASLVLLLMFVLGGIYSRYMTNQIGVHEEERYTETLLTLVEDGASVDAFESKGSDVTYISVSTETEYTPVLVDAFKVFDASNQHIAYIYVIETIGHSEGFKAAYAISIEDDQLLGVKVISHNESTNAENKYFNKIKDSFYDQFKNKDLDVIDFSIDAVSDATESSDAFNVGMKYARELYASDTDFEIINLMLTIDEIRYNFDLATIASYTYVVDITYGLENKTATVGLANDFSYVETLTGEEPSELEIAALPSYVTTADTDKLRNITFNSFDIETNTLTITTRGYTANGIVLEIVLDENLTALEQINLVTSSETYKNDYNSKYKGDDRPAVENAIIDQFNDDGTIIDAIAGASVTSDAIRGAIEWSQDLMTALNGGL